MLGNLERIFIWIVLAVSLAACEKDSTSPGNALGPGDWIVLFEDSAASQFEVPGFGNYVTGIGFQGYLYEGEWGGVSIVQSFDLTEYHEAIIQWQMNCDSSIAIDSIAFELMEQHLPDEYPHWRYFSSGMSSYSSNMVIQIDLAGLVDFYPVLWFNIMFRAFFPIVNNQNTIPMTISNIQIKAK